MIIRCPNCNGALEFDIEQGLLYCKFCGSFHTPKDLDLPETNTEENSSESGAMPEDEEIEIDPEILAATTELNETFLGNTDNPTERKIVKYDSMQEIANAASEARKHGATGNMLYDLPTEQRELNRNRFYKQQKTLHDAYEKRLKDTMDYTKAFAGTSYANLSQEEIENRRKQEWEDEKKRLTQLSEMSMLDKAGEIEKGEKVQRQNYDYYTKNFEGTASGVIPKKKKRVLYTASGARIVRNVGGVLLTTDTPVEEEPASFDNKIYTCTACGAELALTDTEITAFCSYCGQPSIVFDRMDKTEMPDSIIPFVITKEEALKKVQHRLNKGFLIPNKVKKFEVERLRGIYIPYWLFDADYEDSMVIKANVKTGRAATITRYYRVNGKCNLFYYPVDASKNLNDKSSRKLEPYDYSGLRPFNIAYMSGFYSDRFDMSADTMMLTAMYRAQDQLCELASSDIPGEAKEIMESAPMFHVKKKYYIMLPAWFMTFRYEGKPYTIMVNGQNGKVVGAVPFSEKKFYGLSAGLSVLCSMITVPLWIFLTPYVVEIFGIPTVLIAVCILLAILFFIGWGNIKKYKHNVELAAESRITKYVMERQDMES